MPRLSFLCVYMAWLRAFICTRFCVLRRYKFAEVEVRLAVARLLQQYRLFTVPGEVPKHRSGIVYAPSSVYIRLQQRK